MPQYWKVNICSDNGLVPSGTNPLPEPMWTQIYVTTRRHWATMGQLRPVYDVHTMLCIIVVQHVGCCDFLWSMFHKSFRATDITTGTTIIFLQGQCINLGVHRKKNPGTQHFHYSDVIMSAMMSQITGVSIVCSTVDQKIYQSSASQAFVRGIHWSLVDSSQRAGNAENVPIWWRHHAECMLDPVQN